MTVELLNAIGRALSLDHVFKPLDGDLEDTIAFLFDTCDVFGIIEEMLNN